MVANDKLPFKFLYLAVEKCSFEPGLPHVKIINNIQEIGFNV